MYKVTMKDLGEEQDWRSELIIEDDNGTREHWDGGEPEDNTFGRDWNWVPQELERAYKQGLKDGATESGDER